MAGRIALGDFLGPQRFSACVGDIPAAEGSWTAGCEVPFWRASRKLSAMALLSMADASPTACCKGFTQVIADGLFMFLSEGAQMYVMASNGRHW